MSDPNNEAQSVEEDDKKIDSLWIKKFQSGNHCTKQVFKSFISGNNNSRHLSKIRRHFCSNVFLILVRIFADSSLDFPL